jgi:RNA polymerase sigma-70 factor (ECF subfamily)
VSSSNKSKEKHIEILFREFFPTLTLFAQKFVKDNDTAREIVHVVFINIWEKQSKIDFDKPLKSFLFTSVHNRCLNYIRDAKRKNVNREDDIENFSNDVVEEPLVEVDKAGLEGKIYKAIQDLPERCREIFTLSRFNNLKYAEIAEELDISIKTVEAQMSKAIKILREKITPLMVIIIIIAIAIKKMNMP